MLHSDIMMAQTTKDAVVLRRWVKEFINLDASSVIARLRSTKAEWSRDRLIVSYNSTGDTQWYFDVFAYFLAHDSAKLREIFGVVRELSISGRNFTVLEVDGIYADSKRLIMAFGVSIRTSRGQTWDTSFGLGTQVEHKF